MSSDTKTPPLGAFDLLLGTAVVALLGGVGFAAYRASKTPREGLLGAMRLPDGGVLLSPADVDEIKTKRDFTRAVMEKDSAVLGGAIQAAQEAFEKTVGDARRLEQESKPVAGLLGSFSSEDREGDEDSDYKLRGEWWIDNMGQSMYADGDIGDMNHEAHVIQNLTRSILSDLGVDFNEDAEYVPDMSDLDAEIREALEIDEDADVAAAMVERLRASYPAEGQVEAAVNVTWGGVKGALSDARDYALKYDGWKRVKGNNIETWTLTSSDLNAIKSGLWDAESEIPDNARFDIDVRSNQRFYQNVPMHVIEKGNPAALREYLFVGW